MSVWCLLWIQTLPDSKVHGANMGPTRVLSAPGGPHAGPMNLAIRAGIWSTIVPTVLYATSCYIVPLYTDMTVYNQLLCSHGVTQASDESHGIAIIACKHSPKRPCSQEQ